MVVGLHLPIFVHCSQYFYVAYLRLNKETINDKIKQLQRTVKFRDTVVAERMMTKLAKRFPALGVKIIWKRTNSNSKCSWIWVYCKTFVPHLAP